MIERREHKNKELEKKLRNEEKKEKRKIISKKIFKVFLVIFFIIIAIFLYMHYIGTKGIIVREYKVESNKLPDGFHGFKIVHFSDLHYLTNIKEKEIKKLVNKINELKPDLVLFTGDLIDSNKKVTNDDIKILEDNLKNIKSTLGNYAIKGHDDYNNNFDVVMNKTNFKILNNSYELIYYKDKTPILLTGVGSILKDDCDINKAFSYNEDNVFTVSLIHEPDVADAVIQNNKVDLILAGHSHNGQIKLPIIGNVLKLDGAKKYINSKYDINDTTLYISGGLGTTNYKFRLFNHPSINFYRLVKGTN